MILSRSTLLSTFAHFKNPTVSLSPTLPRLSGFGARPMSATAARPDPFRPAARVAGQRQDVWSIVNEAAAASPVQPIVNMGQGFFGYNPPKFALDAAKDALDRVECNQYSPPRWDMPTAPRRLYSMLIAYRVALVSSKPLRTHTRLSSARPSTPIPRSRSQPAQMKVSMLSAFMGFIEPGDEVIIFEPFFDQYISNIEMPGGTIRYVPLQPPKDGATRTSPASEWTINFEELEKAINPKTKMIVLNSPHNPVGKVFSREELERIGDLCVKHNLIILSDEVYDRLFYVPFTRIATLSPQLYERTLTVGSAGKAFYATGWRVGYLIGPEHLIKYVAGAHTRICYSSVSPLQEAAAVAFEQAEKEGFWDESRTDMKNKISRFCEVFDELGIPYSDPEGGYFVLANMASVKLPADYPFPAHVANRPRDFKLCWFLIQEVGVAAIPPTEFYTDANSHIAEDYLRFAVCKNDDVLETAKERLRGLKKYITH
ncbi:hypothetical protein N7444_012485 [Penicillium canescens]|nr:hypothetical protein N7444_012485 [Penicillium canescens]